MTQDNGSNGKDKFDDVLHVSTPIDETDHIKTEAQKKHDRQFLIKQPIEAYLGAPEVFYRNYFDLEGGTFPDLFSREYIPNKGKKEAQNDCDSRVKYISAHRSGRLYADLLVAAYESKAKKRKEEEKQALEKTKAKGENETDEEFMIRRRAQVKSLIDKMMADIAPLTKDGKK